MRSIATVLAWFACVFVGLWVFFHITVSWAKTDEPIEAWTQAGPRNNVLAGGSDRPRRKGNLFEGDIFWPIVKYREYRACDRYSQYNSLDGISDAAFRFQYVFLIIRQAGYNIDNYNNRKLNYKQLIKYYRLLQNWQKPFTVKTVSYTHLTLPTTPYV